MIKKILLPFLTITALLFQIFISPFLSVTTFAAEQTKYVIGKVDTGEEIRSSVNPLLRETGNSSGKWSAWYGGYQTSTAFITIDGEPAFCIDPDLPFPMNNKYIREVYSDVGIYNILYYGYPHNGTSEKNYVDTYVALNYYLGNFKSPSFPADPGVKYLLDKAEAKTAPIGRFDIKNKIQTSTWNAENNRQETDWYTTEWDGSNGTSYTLNLPEGVSAITGDGKSHTGNVTLNVSESFKLAADASYTGTINLEVPTDVKKKSSLRFIPQSGNVQKLVRGPAVLDPIKVTGIQATFEAQMGSIEVTKQGDDGKLLSGAEYDIKDNGGQVVDHVVTDEGGKVETKQLRMDAYDVVETKAPPGYTLDATPRKVVVEAGKVTPIVITNKQVFFQVRVKKQDTETGDKPQGEAALQGAKYGIYADKEATQLLEEVTIGEDFTALSQKFPLNGAERTVYVKETAVPKGYLLDETIYEAHVTQQDTTTEVFVHDVVSQEQVMKGSISIVKVGDIPVLSKVKNFFKSESTKDTKPLLEGAEFEVYDPKGNVVDKFTTDKDGKAKTKPLPYGHYRVSETKTPTGYSPVKDFEVFVSEHQKEYFYVLEDKAIKSEIKLVKVDAESGKTIPLPGVTFKIKNVATGKWVEQTVTYPNKEKISEFKTSDDGTVHLPEPLVYGKYEVHEASAPSGYVLSKKPIPFAVDEKTNGIEIEIKFGNVAQKGKVTLTKLGEMLTSASTKKTKYGDQYNFTFENKGLAGAEFDVIAKADVMTPDGTLRAKKGAKVAHIATGKDGVATSSELYIGKYALKEVKAPAGFVIENKEIPFEVVYEGQEVPITNVSVSAENKQQELNIHIHKVGEEIEAWENETLKTEMKPLKGIVFGVFAREDIKVGEKVIVPKDSLVSFSKTGEDGVAKLQGKFPQSKFFVKELETDDTHQLLEKEFDFVYEAKDNLEAQDIHIYEDGVAYGKQNLLKIERKSIENYLVKKDFELVKKVELRDSQLKPYYETGEPAADAEFTLKTEKDEVVSKQVTDKSGKILFKDLPVGKYLLEETKPVSEKYQENKNVYQVLVTKDGITVTDEEGKTVSEEGTLTVENHLIEGTLEISKVDVADGNVVLPDAEFTIYDEEGNEVVKGKTGEDGIAKFEKLPYGKYTYRETLAPNGYLINEEVFEFEITKQDEIIKHKVEDEKITGTLEISKVDVADGNVVLPDAEFTIYDEEGNEVVKGKTGEDGIAKFEKLPYGKYTYRETLAPNGYLLNEEVFEFEITKQDEIIKHTVQDQKIPEQPKQRVLPQTNEEKTYLPLILGGFFVVVGIAVYVFNRKRNRA